MNNVKFLPWVGTNLKNEKLIMVLGESHYCNDLKDATPNLTTNIIRDLFNPYSEHEGYKNTYTKFERALSGRKLSFSEKEIFWNSIIFYNYVQFAISGPREAPTSEEFKKSASAFFEVLEKYKPKYVIVWGGRLYNNLPQEGKQLNDIQISNGDSFETWGYKLSGGEVVQLLPILHPSAGFTPEYWYEVMEVFLGRSVKW